MSNILYYKGDIKEHPFGDFSDCSRGIYIDDVSSGLVNINTLLEQNVGKRITLIIEE